MIAEHARLGARHLRVGVHDVAEPLAAPTPPAPEMVDRILDFAEDWTGEAPLLVHCWAGISRSSATAYVLACARNPSADPLAIARALRAASPCAQPNRLLVALADARLGRGGAMRAAVEAIGPGRFTLENEPFALASRHPPA